jgi:hypothetical protein
MGRDKPKKYKNMGYFESQNYYREKAKDFNINLDQFENDAHGGGRYEDFDDDALKKAVRNAQRNDFDYRTSAQHMDGVKGDGSFGDFNKYERAAHKLHRKAGNGGEYSSNKDITTVTNNLVRDNQKQFREDIMSDMDNKYATAERLNALQDKIKQRAEQTGPVEISSTLTNAQRGVGEFEEDMTAQGANVFGAMGSGNDLEQATEEVMASDTSGDSVDYKTQYASNVAGGLQLSGTKTRGPDSGLMRDGSGFG